PPLAEASVRPSDRGLGCRGGRRPHPGAAAALRGPCRRDAPRASYRRRRRPPPSWRAPDRRSTTCLLPGQHRLREGGGGSPESPYVDDGRDGSHRSRDVAGPPQAAADDSAATERRRRPNWADEIARRALHSYRRPPVGRFHGRPAQLRQADLDQAGDTTNPYSTSHAVATWFTDVGMTRR